MSFEIGKFFVVFDPQNATDRARIDREVGHVRKNKELRRILELLLPLSGAVVMENNYIDLDFRASCARFYIYSHVDTNPRCRRMHFFAETLDNEAAVMSLGLETEGYLGYIILRPFESQMLGRTVLSERVLWAACPAGREVYLTCRARHRANLAGAELALVGAPWMQQDTMVAACASASVWMIQWHMAHRFAPDFRLFYTSQITDLAVQFGGGYGLAMPSEGLSTEQILHALRAVGYDPMLIAPIDTNNARTALYAYVESGIPVIVSLDYPRFIGGGDVEAIGHTVVAVGHTLNRSLEPRTDSLGGLSFARTADFVEAFVVQDDAVAPFCFLELLEWSSAATDDLIRQELAPLFSGARTEQLQLVKNQYPCVLVLDRGKSTERVGLLNTFVVPLPSGITLNSDDAEGGALNRVASWYRRAAHAPPQLMARTFLQMSNDLKVYWKTADGMPTDLARALRSHLFSRWVWVTELSTFDQFQSRQGRALGQVIQDSAGRGDIAPVYLAYHMPPEDFHVTDPSRKKRIVTIAPYETFPAFKRPGRAG